MVGNAAQRRPQYRVLVTCVFLNQTPGDRAERFLHAFLRRYPDAEALRRARPEYIKEQYFKTLGLYRRAWNLVKMADQLITNPPRPFHVWRKSYMAAGYWCEVAHLVGIGEYACHAWQLFCKQQFYRDHGFEIVDEWRSVNPSDKELKKYVARRMATEAYAMGRGQCDDIVARMGAMSLTPVQKGTAITPRNGAVIGTPPFTLHIPQSFIDKAQPISASAGLDVKKPLTVPPKSKCKK